MSFLKETEFSGRRTYEREAATHVVADDFRLRVSLTFAWARLQVEKFMRLWVAPRQASSLVHHGEKHFTLLGTRRPALPARRPITDVFPLSPSNGRPRKMRNDN